MVRRLEKHSVETNGAADSQRLDKWLWFARVAKTRTLAAGLVTDGRVRVNRVRTVKPAQVVKTGDVLTISVARGVRVLKVLEGGARRGPASEAQMLYEEIVPLEATRAPKGPNAAVGAGDVEHDATQGGPMTEAGSGRPTKKNRRELDRLRGRDED